MELNDEAVYGGTGQKNVFPCSEGSKGRALADKATNYCCRNLGRAM